jgi:predicted 3-demethylubiquinone-9 3-methyltransferase (glyoxalase superfamily)
MDRITPCLWFDTEAEQAAQFYTSVFPDSRIVRVTHYGSAGPRPEGMVMEVEFELDGRSYLALNGGPQFRFTEAISLQAWQIVPRVLYELIADADREKAQRVIAAMLQMGKLDVAELERAAGGVPTR